MDKDLPIPFKIFNTFIEDVLWNFGGFHNESERALHNCGFCGGF